MRTRFNLLRNNLISTFYYYLLFLFCTTLYRIIFTIKYYPNNPNFENSDLFRAYFMGFRYDTQYISYFLIVFILLAILSLFINQRVYKIGSKIALPILTLFLLILSTGDFINYINLQKHLSIESFRIFGDESVELMKSAWEDYPMIIISLGIIIIIFSCIKIVNKINSIPIKPKSVSFNTIFTIAFFTLFMLGIRGSFGTFPLRTKHATISNNKFVNDVVKNPIFSFKEALSLKYNYKINTDIKKELKKYGYNSIEEPFKIYFGESSMSHTDLLYSITKENKELEQEKPNVILILMESMGTDQFLMHSKSLNMLGELENQLNDCIVFKNFTSNKNGTNETIESLLINAPQTDIPRSEFSNVKFSNSLAIPYVKKAYEVEYLYMGALGWRGMGEFCINQGFTNMFGRKEIEKKYKDSECNEWGVHDEYFFRMLFDRIKENNDNGKPLFSLALTGTNHSPYMIPKSYKLKPQNIPSSVYKNAKINKEQVDIDFATYQYAADCVGNFLKKLKASKYGKNTIVAITGDHNNRHLYNYNSDNLFLWRAVPLIMYIPQKYLKGKNINTQRYGSHKDIMPTLINLSLSQSKYFNSGYDLLSNDEHYYFAKNQAHAYKDLKAVNIFNSEAYKLENRSTLKDKKNPETIELQAKAKAYEFLMRYAIIKDIHDKVLEKK